MKAFNKFIYFVSAVLLALALGACTPEENPEYVKAELPDGALAYFVNVPESFDLTEGDGSIELTLTRDEVDEEVTVALNSTADEIFTVPSSVTFAAGESTAVITVSYNPDDIVPDVAYSITISLKDNSTPFAPDNCTFTAGIVSPVLYKVFDTAVITEGFWGEVHTHQIKYIEEGNVRYCVISSDEKCNCQEAPCAGGMWGTGVDFEFIWYLDKYNDKGYQIIEVPEQFMGWQNGGMDVYLYDQYHVYSDNLGYDVGTFFEYAEKYPEEMCYYDGNGGFYFWLNYMVPAAGAGMGFGSDPFDVVAICQDPKFVRTVDYNTAFEYSALYEGSAASMIFSNDGVSPVEFPTSVRYNADYTYDPKSTETLMTEYYLPDYFASGYGLAFSAPIPEQLKGEVKISDVENDQYTGLVMLGDSLYVSIKSSSKMSFAEGSEFPVINLDIAAYSVKDGEKHFNYGSFKEVVNVEAYGKDNYSADDIVGLQKNSYVGVWNITYNDWYDDGAEKYSQILIQDAGADADGVEWLTIHNLSGLYGADALGGWDDAVYAEWYGGDGCLYIGAQNLANFTYSGTECDATLYPFDPVGTTNSGTYVMAGYVAEDGVLAFPAYPETPTYNGLYIVSTQLGALAAAYNIVATPAESASASLAVSPKSFKSYAEMTQRGYGVKKADAVVVEKRVNSSNMKPFEKSSRSEKMLEKMNFLSR